MLTLPGMSLFLDKKNSIKKNNKCKNMLTTKHYYIKKSITMTSIKRRNIINMEHILKENAAIALKRTKQIDSLFTVSF